MATATMQQFVKKESAWRFLKFALKLRAPEPAYGHILITLANHADNKGVCYPSCTLLMHETGYKSKNTVICALKHWKLAGVLTWQKGWGNAHGRRSNVYQFHEDAMLKLIATQPTRCSDEETLQSDEGTLRPDEETLTTDEGTPLGVSRYPRLASKVPVVEGLSYKTSQLPKGGVASLSDREPTSESSPATQAHVEESPIGVPSSEGTLKIPSLGRYVVTHSEALAYYPGEGWAARRDIGRGLTGAEIDELRRLKRERIQPNNVPQL